MVNVASWSVTIKPAGHFGVLMGENLADWPTSQRGCTSFIDFFYLFHSRIYCRISFNIPNLSFNNRKEGYSEVLTSEVTEKAVRVI